MTNIDRITDVAAYLAQSIGMTDMARNAEIDRRWPGITDDEFGQACDLASIRAIEAATGLYAKADALRAELVRRRLARS